MPATAYTASPPAIFGIGGFRGLLDGPALRVP